MQQCVVISTLSGVSSITTLVCWWWHMWGIDKSMKTCLYLDIVLPLQWNIECSFLNKIEYHVISDDILLFYTHILSEKINV